MTHYYSRSDIQVRVKRFNSITILINLKWNHLRIEFKKIKYVNICKGFKNKKKRRVMRKHQYKRLPIEYKVRKAIKILRNNVVEIQSVQGWADEVGVSRRWLCKSMKMVHNKSPKIILREVRYEKVVTLIRKDEIEASCYSVAVDAGFKKAKDVSRFLSTFYNTTFTELKMKLLKKEVQIDFFWLNGCTSD